MEARTIWRRAVYLIILWCTSVRKRRARRVNPRVPRGGSRGCASTLAPMLSALGTRAGKRTFHLGEIKGDAGRRADNYWRRSASCGVPLAPPDGSTKCRARARKNAPLARKSATIRRDAGPLRSFFFRGREGPARNGHPAREPVAHATH